MDNDRQDGGFRGGFPLNEIESRTPPDGPQAAEFPEPGTPAWGAMNGRRAELIRRRVRLGLEGLSEDEQAELAHLQAMSLRALKHAHSGPASCLADIEALQRDLRGHGTGDHYRPPEGHRRPNGVRSCHFCRRHEGTLLEVD
jgi:hypothetical protein